MASGSFFRRPGVLLALALCALAAIMSVLGSLVGGSGSSQKTITLASPRGTEAFPSFSPDGKRLVYSVRLSKDDDYHLFIRNLPYGGRWQLTSEAGSDIAPAWSPDGASVAFLRITEGGAGCMIVPAVGGAAHKVADCAAPSETEQPLPAAAWTPDSRSLAVSLAEGDRPPAIALVPAAGGAPKRVTDPPQGGLGDSTPAISPDGKTLAFVRSTSSDGADVFVTDLSGGQARRMTFDDGTVRGLAWMPDGRTLIYGGRRMGNSRLWSVPASGGSPRDLAVGGRQPQYPATGAGGMLAFTESPAKSAIWRAPLKPGEGNEGAPLIRSSGREWSPSYSPDGKKIVDLSDQSGSNEIWVSDADGGNRVQITHFNGSLLPNRPRWSPDGKTLVFEVLGSGVREVDVVPATGGQPKRVVMDAAAPVWSHDGKSIYYQSRAQICKASAAGSDQREITKQPGTGPPEETVDGKFVYYARWRSFWRVPANGGGDEEEAFQPERDMMWGSLQAFPKGLYYVELARRRTPSLNFYDFATRKSTVVFQPGESLSAFSVSPDAKYVLYPRTDRSETNLVLVEGFK